MSSTSFKVRRATPADADAIARVHVQSWQEGYEGQLTPDQIATKTVEGRTTQWRDALNGEVPRSVVLVAEDDEGIFGFVSAEPSEEEGAQTADLAALYLTKRGWGGGASHALMTSALEELSADGDYDDVLLWVLETNDRARRFYERGGWQADGGRKDCFGGVDAPAVRYRKQLTTKVE